ncbi:hypothetical protein FRC09_011059, partial [Ceratobasidium sp. 395]
MGHPPGTSTQQEQYTQTLSQPESTTPNELPPRYPSPFIQPLVGPSVPDIQHVQALVLPANTARHYSVSIELRGYLGPAGVVRWVPSLGELFGERVSPTDTTCAKGPSGAPLRFPLHFFFEIPPDMMGHA